MQELISVGIPTYNRPLGLRRTLEAICEQTYRNLEILVSDNCSPDPEVARIIAEFLSRDSRIISFRQDSNIGAYQNCFFLLNHAKGKYFFFAADDDGWANNYVEVLAEQLNNHTEAVIAVSTVIVKTGTLVNMDNAPEEVTIDGFEQCMEKNADLRIYHHVLHPCYMQAHLIYGLARTKPLQLSFGRVFEVYGSTVTSTDLQIVLDILCRGYVVVSRETYKYYLSHDSAGSNPKWTFPLIMEHLKARKKLINLAEGLSDFGKICAARIIDKAILAHRLWYFPRIAQAGIVRSMRTLGVHRYYLSVKAATRKLLGLG